MSTEATSVHTPGFVHLTTSDTSYPNVGERLRTLRQRHGYTLRALAEHSGLNINTLSLIEHNRTSPSVNTLQQLARALDVPITAFFEMETIARRVVFTRHDARPTSSFEMACVENLAKDLEGNVLQPYVATLAPEASSGQPATVHTGVEFAYCLSGSVCFTIEEQSYNLEPGDSLTFQARLAHRWQNVSGHTAEVLFILCDPGS